MKFKNKLLYIMLLCFVLTGCNKKNELLPINETKNTPAQTVRIENGTKKTQIGRPVDKTSEKQKTMVTFVELGSVNCIPCKMMQPVMKEITKEYGNQVKVVFYDVWTQEGRPYVEKYRINLIPTQVFLDEKEKEFFRHEGFFSKEEILKIFGAHGVKINVK
ncbi:MAG: thioredoxin family protein [Elusimicrobia bacterium]|nr:thioredoxin family protein [Elusimicrobiota bacterium]